MERLTKRFTDGVAYCEEIEDVGIKSINSKTYVGKAVEKLAEYEDLEEKGMLLKLPCKTGTPVYFIEFNQHDGFYIELKEFSISMINSIDRMYLSKEESEQKLKEMETNND